ncbi:MAG: elongation factor G [bacterium]
MAKQDPSFVRNLGVIGHGGAGKTSLGEAMLFNAKVTTRLNRVDDHNSILDFLPEEIERKSSISSSMAMATWNATDVYFMDTPGNTNFLADTKGVLKAMDSALVLLSAVSGVKVETEKVWNYATEYGIPKMVFINKMDRDRADFYRAVESMESILKKTPLIVTLPIGKEAGFKGVFDLLTMKAFKYADNGSGTFETSSEVPEELKDEVESYREKLVETAVESDDQLLERYLEGGEISDQELLSAIAKGTLSGQFVPVYCGSAARNIGVHQLMDGLVSFLPSPVNSSDLNPIKGTSPKTSEELTRRPSSDEPFSAQVFKTIVDPFAGKLSLFRVYSGVLRSDSTVLNATRDEKERVGHLFCLYGKDQKPVDEVGAGQLGAVAKLKNTSTGDTLCDEKAPIKFSPLIFPEPVISYAIEPKSKGDEDKLSNALHRISEEEPTLRVHRHEETLDLIASVMGEVHMEVILSALKRKFGVEVTLKAPRIPYKETIRKKVEVQGKYKKQSGGRGQYGDVCIRFEPLPRGGGFQFVDEVVGGVVPRQYIPAVEKGLLDAIKSGPLAGAPIVDIQASLYYGSYHDVDSSEMAFKIAASMALKKAWTEANPVLLEPIMKLQVMVSDEFIGGVISDLNSKRGKVLGFETRGVSQVVTALIPMAETLQYSASLRSITGGRGSFEMKFDHYEELPAHLSEKVIEAEKKGKGKVEE